MEKSAFLQTGSYYKLSIYLWYARTFSKDIYFPQIVFLVQRGMP